MNDPLAHLLLCLSYLWRQQNPPSTFLTNNIEPLGKISEKPRGFMFLGLHLFVTDLTNFLSPSVQ